MAKQDLSPEQRGVPDPEEMGRAFGELRNPQTPEERERAAEYRRAVRRNAREIRKGLPPGGSAEVLMTRIGPGPSGEVLATRIGPGPSGRLLKERVGGPKVTDYFDELSDAQRDSGQPHPTRIHDIPYDIDPQTTEEA